MVYILCRTIGRGLAPVALLFLGACALPVPIQIASWLADGVSYVTTQKTIADHGLSAVMGEDCAFIRSLSEGRPCREEGVGPDVAVAAVDPPDELINFETAAGTPGEDLAAPVSDDPVVSWDVVPDDEGKMSGLASMSVPPRKPNVPSVLVVDNTRDNLYLVVGSYARAADARRFVARHKDLSLHVLNGFIGRQTMFRVALGPFPGGSLSAAHKTARKMGVRDAWALRVEGPVSLAMLPGV